MGSSTAKVSCCLPLSDGAIADRGERRLPPLDSRGHYDPVTFREHAARSWVWFTWQRVIAAADRRRAATEAAAHDLTSVKQLGDRAAGAVAAERAASARDASIVGGHTASQIISVVTSRPRTSPQPSPSPWQSYPMR